MPFVYEHCIDLMNVSLLNILSILRKRLLETLFMLNTDTKYCRVMGLSTYATIESDTAIQNHKIIDSSLQSVLKWALQMLMVFSAPLQSSLHFPT